MLLRLKLSSKFQRVSNWIRKKRSRCRSRDHSDKHFLKDGHNIEQLKALADPSLPNLPRYIQLDILFYVYDDIETIETLIDCHYNSCFNQVSEKSLKRHISLSILALNDDHTFCRICNNLLCYACQLTDCGHVVCGLCAWDTREELGSCPCGVRLRSRPKRLHPKLADGKAHWLLNKNENRERFARNEVELYRAPPGSVFGANGKINRKNPFRCVGFEDDFDYLEALDIREEAFDLKVFSMLPKDCGRLFILLCPAHENYSPYAIEDAETYDFDFHNLIHRRWLRCISNEDMVTLEEEGFSKNVTRERFEIRLTGWEENVGVSAEYNF